MNGCAGIGIIGSRAGILFRQVANHVEEEGIFGLNIGRANAVEGGAERVHQNDALFLGNTVVKLFISGSKSGGGMPPIRY